jgi:predicted RND superfamily exporter protein
MVVLFGSVWIGLLSMIPNVIPILITLGTMGVCGISLNFMTVPIAAIALGLAVDDTIHFLSRFRLEFRKDGSYAAAIERTLESAGKPIIITSVILVVGFLIFLFSDFQYTRNLGMLISFTMASALLGDLFVLPALLLVFKPVGRKAELSPPGKIL